MKAKQETIEYFQKAYELKDAEVQIDIAMGAKTWKHSTFNKIKNYLSFLEKDSFESLSFKEAKRLREKIRPKCHNGHRINS